MLAAALWLIAGSAGAATTPPAIEAPTATVLPALLVVHESEGCTAAGEGSDALVSEFDGDLAVFRQRIWLTLRESVTQGGAWVTRAGKHLRAEVETVVAPVEPSVPMPACIRPVELVLSVPGLPEGEYDLQFVRRP